MDLILYNPVKQKMLSSLHSDGKLLIQYRDSLCKRYVAGKSFESTFEGVNALVCGWQCFGSIKFGDKINDYDLVASFEWNGDDYIISLYSEKRDVSVLAEKYGGGGHRGAAGFHTKVLPFIKK